jgi:hypothetical protein
MVPPRHHEEHSTIPSRRIPSHPQRESGLDVGDCDDYRVDR